MKKGDRQAALLVFDYENNTDATCRAASVGTRSLFHGQRQHLYAISLLLDGVSKFHPFDNLPEYRVFTVKPVAAIFLGDDKKL